MCRNHSLERDWLDRTGIHPRSLKHRPSPCALASATAALLYGVTTFELG